MTFSSCRCFQEQWIRRFLMTTTSSPWSSCLHTRTHRLGYRHKRWAAHPPSVIKRSFKTGSTLGPLHFVNIFYYFLKCHLRVCWLEDALYSYIPVLMFWLTTRTVNILTVLCFSVFIIQTTTMSSPTSYHALLYWKNHREHSWASTSVGVKHHSWESSYQRCVTPRCSAWHVFTVIVVGLLTFCHCLLPPTSTLMVIWWRVDRWSRTRMPTEQVYKRETRFFL